MIRWDTENKHSTYVSQTERGGKSTREGDKIGVGRQERMKLGKGKEDRDDRTRDERWMGTSKILRKLNPLTH